MRKIVLNLAISLDGLIEGPNGEYDWCFTDQDYGMQDFLNRIDAIFYGRKSYTMMMGEGGGQNPFGGKQDFVFSNTLTAKKEYTLVNGDVIEKVKAIKASKGKDIWLFGGAELTTTLLAANLVDELQLAVHPIILGKGKALFGGFVNRIPLNLIGSKTYSSGLISLHYTLRQ